MYIRVVEKWVCRNSVKGPEVFSSLVEKVEF